MLLKLRRFLIPMITGGVLCGAGLVLAMQTDGSSAPDQLKASVSQEDGSSDTQADKLRPHDMAQILTGHGASTDCVPCHGGRPDPNSTDTAGLVASIPGLCSTCHKEYASLDGWVHGPVGTGDCLFCHQPHWGDGRSSLTRPVPELCHQCHTIEMLKLVNNHSYDSHRHCSECHESHSGSNRMLLTERFLRTETGAAYTRQEARPEPRYTFVDRRDSLVGLGRIRVIPVIDRQEVLSRYGLTPECVQEEVERCLRQQGVQILPNDEGASTQSGLHVNLRLVELRTAGYSNEVRILSGSVGVSLRQTVELVSRPKDAERRLCSATTWDTSAVVVWGTPQIQEGLKDALDLLVGKFCSDYLAVNPQGTQPASTQHASGDSGQGVTD